MHRVSGDSPFAPDACGTSIFGPADPGDDTDPTFAVAPQGLVSGWSQDGGLGIVTARSNDDGATWTQSVPPALSICQAGGTSPRVFEPRIVVDGAGTTLLLTGDYPGAIPSVTVSTSPDGGATWSQPTTFNVVGPMTSNPTMSADPSNPHAAAISWISHSVDSIWFARTTDDGVTWSTARPIHLAPAGRLVANTSLVTLRDGTIVEVATEFPDTDLAAKAGLPNITPAGAIRKVSALRSTDHGKTWSQKPIASLSDLGLGPRDPVLADDGSLYILISNVENGRRVWKLLRSTDGATWSPATTVPLRDDAFPSRDDQTTPNIAVMSDGTIAVLYDDHRNDVPGDQPLATDVWLTYSRDGGQTWNDLHLGGPFDFNAANRSTWDYQQVHAVGSDLGAVFPLGAPSATEGPTDVFFARISF